jgi:hypothetical protein
MPEAVDTTAISPEQPIAEQEAPSTEVEPSLADHEAAFAPGAKPAAPAEPADPDAAATERDETGKFKPRHRAKSQEATPDDVPRIAALTKRLRETEAERDALKTRQSAPEPATRRAEPTEPATPAHPTATFPAFDVWLATKGNEEKTFEDFIDARADWRYDRRRETERADDAKAAVEKTQREDFQKYQDQMPAALKDHPDFDDAIAAAPRISKVLERASIKAGPKVAYYLATHPEEASALTQESLVEPDNPAFPAAVAAMTRYISTLVASQRSPAPAAASTGSALALAPPVPRPPNPVRTGALHAADEPPGDDASLADHEKAFGPKRRRA